MANSTVNIDDGASSGTALASDAASEYATTTAVTGFHADEDVAAASARRAFLLPTHSGT